MMRLVRILSFLAAAALLPAQTLVIAHKWSDSVGFYDSKTGRSLATVAVGVRPHEMVFSADGKSAFVTNYGLNTWTQTEPGGNTISVLDLAGRKESAKIDLGQYRRPHGIERGRRSGLLYVTTDLPPSVIVVDPVKRSVVRRLDVGAKNPHMLAVSHDESRVWVANSGSASVTAMAADGSGKAVHIDVGGIPMGIELTEDGSMVYVATRSSNQIVAIHPKTNVVDHRIDIQGQPARLRSIRGDSLLIASLIGSGEAAVIDRKTRKELHRLKPGAAAEGMYVDRSGRFLYISAQGEDKVVKFDMTTWKPVLEIKTLQRPDPILEF